MFSRWRFSMIVASSAPASSSSRTRAGIVGQPASFEARRRRAPAIRVKPSSCGRTRIGWRTPRRRMLAASSSRLRLGEHTPRIRGRFVDCVDRQLAEFAHGYTSPVKAAKALGARAGLRRGEMPRRSAWLSHARHVALERRPRDLVRTAPKVGRGNGRTSARAVRMDCRQSLP